MTAKKDPAGRKPTQTERAYNVIKRAILRGEINEGVFLSEAEMRRRGIGRTPFREACNRLHLEGLLEVVPQRGYLVSELSFQAVRDVFEVRLILEAHIAELATMRARPGEIEELERIARSAKKAGSDPEEVIRINGEFHLCLARMSHNRELVRLLSGILDQTQRLMYMELQSSRLHASESLSLHSRIVAALANRDPDAARHATLQDITTGQTATFGGAIGLPATATDK